MQIRGLTLWQPLDVMISRWGKRIEPARYSATVDNRRPVYRRDSKNPADWN